MKFPLHSIKLGFDYKGCVENAFLKGKELKKPLFFKRGFCFSGGASSPDASGEPGTLFVF